MRRSVVLTLALGVLCLLSAAPASALPPCSYAIGYTACVSACRIP